jgi:hypothetical protein
MIATSNVTIRVDITTFIATSHSDMLAMTKNHLSTMASSSEQGLGADDSYSSSLRTKLGSATKTQQQQTREYKRTPQVPPHQVRVKSIDRYAMI